MNRELADDSCPSVREVVCSRSDCPAELLEKLSTDPDPLVLLAVASNPNTPPNILQRLSRAD